MAEAELLLTIDPLGAEPIEGELCPSCALPALIRIYFTIGVVGASAGSTVPDVQTHVVCADCEATP